MKWDAVALTASNETQKKAFELQLELLPQLKDCAEKYFCFEDKPGNVRIGSGGSTILALNHLSEYYGTDFSSKRILLIHSGGLSQRLPIASACGKVFLVLPGGKTVLEMKLLSYRPILRVMPPGVLIAASDTLEYIPQNIGGILPGDVTLFAHPSGIKVALQHGVYVLKDGTLASVLQKPTLEELKSSGALKPNSDLQEADNVSAKDHIEGDQHALTDSFFLLSPKVALNIASLKEHAPLDCETCCYGDFLRALGTLPQLGYLKAEEPLGTWRQRFAAIFRGLSCRVVILPQNSFFHFGTPLEVIEHLKPTSVFSRRFNLPSSNCSFSVTTSESKISESALIEWCKFPQGVVVGNGSLLSGLQSSKLVNIPGEVMATTIIMENGGNKSKYVTAIFKNHDDLKEKKTVLNWFDVVLRYDTPTNLWSAKIFKVCGSMEESLDATLTAAKSGQCYDNAISLSEALDRKDLVEMINFRKGCLN